MRSLRQIKPWHFRRFFIKSTMGVSESPGCNWCSAWGFSGIDWGWVPAFNLGYAVEKTRMGWLSNIFEEANNMTGKLHCLSGEFQDGSLLSVSLSYPVSDLSTVEGVETVRAAVGGINCCCTLFGLFAVPVIVTTRRITFFSRGSL